MCRHITLITKCVHLVLISSLISAKIVANYYTSTNQNDDDNQFNQLSAGQIPSQSEQKLNYQFSNLNPEQSTELEKLVRQSLEKIFSGEPSIGGASSFGLKTPALDTPNFDLAEDTAADQNPHLSDPHVLKVPVPQPYPVHIPVKQPFTVPIYKLVPEEVEKRVPIPVKKLVPVYKEKPVRVIVEKHHPVPVYKPYPVPVHINTHVLYDDPKGHVPKWY